MTQVITAVFENGVLKPLQKLDLADQEQVRVTVEQLPPERVAGNSGDPLVGIRVATGIKDLADKFDDYRFGHRQP